MTPVETERRPISSLTGSGISGAACVSLLKAAQNKDGGWGFRPHGESRVEPTAWVVLALQAADASPESRHAGLQFLRASQLPDGSWPASPGQTAGCWATSVASWALLADAGSRSAATTGLQWVCNDWPRGASLFRRIVRRLARHDRINSQNDSLVGWGWTPGTASWVEPTAYALLALSHAPNDLLPRGVEKRRQLATAMLYDRMCPGGGWNCGNPRVYGVPGDPSIQQTVWALLALRNEQFRKEQTLSLQWLEANLASETRKGAASLVLAKLCLDAYARPWPTGVPRVEEVAAMDDLMGNVSAVAWMCLALSPGSTSVNPSRENG